MKFIHAIIFLVILLSIGCTRKYVLYIEAGENAKVQMELNVQPDVIKETNIDAEASATGI